MKNTQLFQSDVKPKYDMKECNLYNGGGLHIFSYYIINIYHYFDISQITRSPNKKRQIYIIPDDISSHSMEANSVISKLLPKMLIDTY